jgi:hypothetical protein
MNGVLASQILSLIVLVCAHLAATEQIASVLTEIAYRLGRRARLPYGLIMLLLSWTALEAGVLSLAVMIMDTWSAK